MEHNIPKSHKEQIANLNFRKFKKDILAEINNARSNPLSYQEKIKNYMNTMKLDDVVVINGVQVKLFEGKSVLEEAIEFLSTQKEVQKLKLVPAMDEAANELLIHLKAREGLIDTEQILYKDIYDAEARLNKFGVCFGAVDEIIDCGCFDAELLIISLILGDGDDKRLERDTLFLEEFKFIGIATSMLPSQRICSIINVCQEFVSPGEYIPKHFKKLNQNQQIINNKLYLSKKIINQTEDDSQDIINEKEEKNYTPQSNDHSEKKKVRSNLKKKNNVQQGSRKSSLMTFSDKKNSVNKYINFLNCKDTYLNSIIERLKNEEDDFQSDEENDDVYEYYEITEEIQTKKTTSRRNKNSIIGIDEIEELEKEKNTMNLPDGVYRITWNEKIVDDPYDNIQYFIVEKNVYRYDGEILQTIYTKKH